MLSLNVRTPVDENNHTSHRVQDPSLIRISQHTPMMVIRAAHTQYAHIYANWIFAYIRAYIHELYV